MMPLAADLLFWCSAAVIAYSYAGYAALMAALSRLFPVPPRDTAAEPTLSIMIAAYNEEECIERKLRETLALDYPPGKVEVVVVSDGSSDRTGEICARVAAAEPRLRFFARPRAGKTAAQNYGAAQCLNDIIVFSDATSRFEQDALRRLTAWFASPRVGAVSGIVRFFDPDRGESPTGSARQIYGGYEQTLRYWQGRVYSATACSGPIYAVRRADFVPLPAHACSDMVEPLEVVRAGRRVLYAPDAVAWEETTRSVGEEFRMRVRVTTQGLQGLIDAGSLLAPWRHPWISFQLLSHKFSRYFLPVPLAGLLLSSALLTCYRWWAPWLLAAQLAFYAAAALAAWLPAGRRPKVLHLPLYFCTLNAAILRSVAEAWRGNRFAVWETRRDGTHQT